jgi:hypothetical protein
MSRINEALADTFDRGLPYEEGVMSTDIIGIDFHNPAGCAVTGALQTEDYARTVFERAASVGLIDPDDIANQARMRVARGALLLGAPDLHIRIACHRENLTAPIWPLDASPEDRRIAAQYQRDTARNIGRIMEAIDDGSRYPSTEVVLYNDTGESVDDNLLRGVGIVMVAHTATRSFVYPADGFSPPLPDSPIATALVNQIDRIFDHTLPHDLKTSGHNWTEPV